jgi:sugar transferase (PEP-CTERM/EpsH1 system associated)
MTRDSRPLVLHVVFRFSTGGLENGLVNLINYMPESAYRHAILALRDMSDFRHRIKRADVPLISLNKGPGHGVGTYPAFWRVLRELRPAVLHTRNLGPLEMQSVAALAGVRVRVHGEHGRDIDDVHGTNRRHQVVRRVYSPFVHRYVALSRDLEGYLVNKVGVSAGRITQIYNGVDTTRFSPPLGEVRPIVSGAPFGGPGHWLVGTVGRMQSVKNQVSLAHAFVRAITFRPELKRTARLVMVGDGPLLAEIQTILADAQLKEVSWLAGERDDVADVMRTLNCFVLPSLAEGISNTILEAMATGLPVIATEVGGNAELVAHKCTGLVVPPNDVDALAGAMLQMHDNPASANVMGNSGRVEVERRFSLHAMVAAYQDMYDRQLALAGSPRLES